MTGAPVRRWQAANHGASKRKYFVCRPGTLDYLRGKSGHLVRFASFEAAAARAKLMNDAEEGR